MRIVWQGVADVFCRTLGRRAKMEIVAFFAFGRSREREKGVGAYQGKIREAEQSCPGKRA